MNIRCSIETARVVCIRVGVVGARQIQVLPIAACIVAVVQARQLAATAVLLAESEHACPYRVVGAKTCPELDRNPRRTADDAGRQRCEAA